MEPPVVGLIVPPLEPFLPPDAKVLYGDEVRFVVQGLGIEAMSTADFDAAIDRIAIAARTLARQGAASIALMGTSLSFFRGGAFNSRVQDAMREASARPSVTATTAVVSALRGLGAGRLAVAAAYTDDMNDRLKGYLEEAGFQVESMVGMNITQVREAIAVTEDALLELGAEACAQAPAAQALFLSCGAFATAEVNPRIEAKCGIPVVSSTPAALRAVVALALQARR